MATDEKNATELEKIKEAEAAQDTATVVFGEQTVEAAKEQTLELLKGMGSSTGLSDAVAIGGSIVKGLAEVASAIPVVGTIVPILRNVFELCRVGAFWRVPCR